MFEVATESSIKNKDWNGLHHVVKNMGSLSMRIWAKTEEHMITDLILLVGSPDEFVLVCFAGNLELGNISGLAELFEAGKLKQLTKTSQAVAIDFEVNPNPSNGQFNLSYSDETDVPNVLTIMDLNGRQITLLNLSGAPTQQIMLHPVL